MGGAKHLDAKTWAAGIVFLGLAAWIGHVLPTEADERSTARLAQPVPSESQTKASNGSFSPPRRDAVPENEFGDMVRLGAAIFRDTQQNASAFVGNSLQCANCHLDDGRRASSAPLWAAYVAYPAYRAKNGHVNTFAERLQGCFRFSMNGKAPPLGDKVLVALESYAYFLATGASVGRDLPGRGYPKLAKPAKLDRDHGKSVYAEKCALCHNNDGSGRLSVLGNPVFPPLWGAKSYNWGAGMSSIANAAGFIKANMPLGQGETLSDQDAWDVAAYIDGQERPQDPRFTGSIRQTRNLHHDSPFDLYGTVVDGRLLGEQSPPAGPQTSK